MVVMSTSELAPLVLDAYTSFKSGRIESRLNACNLGCPTAKGKFARVTFSSEAVA
jgi:hypothetical protein